MSKLNATSSSSAMASVFQPSEQALRDIVLDYLVHNSFVNTARTFASESAVHVRSNEITGDLRLACEKELDTDATPDSDDAGDAMAVEEELEGHTEDESEEEDDEMDDDEEDESSVSVDMTDIQAESNSNDNALPAKVIELANVRREIRIHILSGRVDEAQALLRLRFPEVLGEDDESTIPGGGGDRVPGARNASVSSKVNITTLLPHAPHDRLPYTSQRSINPVHIALNLRILDFIEAARTVPLVYAGDTLRSSSHTTHTAVRTLIQERSSDAFSAQQTDLLHKAQRLYAAVESLRGQRDRELYRKELNGVGGLLAYPEPEKSPDPTAQYMKQSRREAVADQVNSAIFYHLRQPATSHLDLYVRQSSTVWSIMHDNNITLPPCTSDWPVDPAVLQVRSVSSPLSNENGTEAGGSSGAKTGGEKKKEKKEGDVAPYFDFEAFMRL